MRFFVVQIFHFSGQCVASEEIFYVFIVAPFIDSTNLTIVAEADLLCGDCLSENLSQIGSFH